VVGEWAARIRSWVTQPVRQRTVIAPHGVLDLLLQLPHLGCEGPVEKVIGICGRDLRHSSVRAFP
ncbi:hypothetical protein AB0O04_35650, partial [Streptomyces althioticus]|uniref:hypothetical protein n=1 Tax=Streptomyces althioticus TaxID=83380 RepID=UPI0034130D6F